MPICVALRVAAQAALLATSVASHAFAADLWNIMCFQESGHTLAVRAIAADGSTYAVKAIPGAHPELLDVKAVEPELGARIPVKVLPPAEDRPYSDVKAIARGNLILPIKAITNEGETLDVKAFFDSDLDLYDISCITSDGRQLGLRAISPAGRVFDVKGLKDLPGQGTLRVEIEAHIKARPPR
jgi:hypothetical protein